MRAIFVFLSVFFSTAVFLAVVMFIYASQLLLRRFGDDCCMLVLMLSVYALEHGCPCLVQVQ